MMPSLPQHDAHPSRRLAQLGKARDLYRYSYDRLPGIALAETVPEPDAPTPEWVVVVCDTLTKILVNHSKFTARNVWSCQHDPAHATALASAKSSLLGAIQTALDHVTKHAMGGDVKETLRAGIHDYADVFNEIRLPTSTLTWDDDDQFALYRTCGPNPMEIRRIGALDDRFPVSDALYRRVMGDGDSLAAAGAEGRLFLADYAAVEGLTCGLTAAGRQKYLTAPLALFAVGAAGSEAGAALQPVAIQCAQRPGADVPIFSPQDGYFAWLLAKTHVQAADGNMHQAVRHLAHTHLVLDPIVMAARRQLAPSHPLTVLLSPHFEGTLEINNAAWKKLMADGGGVELVLAGEIAATRAFAAKGALEWSFDDHMFPREMASRGLDDPTVLPLYPYRHDGQILWDALHAWVNSYLRLYYTSSADVQADFELQDWVGEMVAPAPLGGQMKGLGQGGRIETLEYLVDAVTHIIFTASVQHAAVNFPQFDMMAYAPKMPLALYTPAPRGRAVSAEEYFQALPPLNLAYAQAQLGYLLGSVHYTRLGQYQRKAGLSLENVVEEIVDAVEGAAPLYFEDPRVAAPLAAFQARLAEIEATQIVPAERRFGYDYLVPSSIPQSINI